MGWFSGISDIFKGAGDIVTDTAREVGKLGQTAIDTVSKFGSGLDDAVHSTINNIPSLFSTAEDLTKLGMTAGIDTLRSMASNPTEISAYTDPIKRNLAKFDDSGTELFGSGSWVTGGVNYASTGNPFYGAGTTAAQLIEGDKYTSGSTTSAGSLMGLYDVGSNLSSGGGAAPTDTTNGVSTNYGNVDVPTGGYSPTYTDPSLGTGASFLGSGSGSATGAFGASTPLTQGNGMNYNTNYGNTDLNYTGTSADGLGSGLDYNGGLINGNQTYLTGKAPSIFDQFGDLYSQFSNGVNSPLGQIGLSLVGQSNPRLAALTRLAGAGGASSNDQMASSLATGLADLYKTRQAKKQYNTGLDEMAQARDAALNQYAPGSAYSEQMRKQLERQDAQAGRRSQYGQREVELAAKLAQQRAEVQKSYMGTMNNRTDLRNKLVANSNNNVENLLGLYGKNAPAINSNIRSGYNYLSNLF